MFTHLHVHSHYSLLDGLPKIDDLIRRAKECGMTSLALTDHGVMYGIIEFYQKCLSAGIKPILGMEAYVAVDKRTEKRPHIDNRRYHLTLLVKNRVGYKNLIKLTSLAHLEGFYYKPRIDKELLKEYSEGLIALSGCLVSELSQQLLSGGIERGLDVVKEHVEIFGKENYFLEVQDIPNLPQSVKAREMIIEIHKQTGIPIVATKDVHYISLADKEAHDVLLCIQTGKKVTDEKRMDLKDTDAYFADEEEMRSAFSDISFAVENTQLVVQKCTVELEVGNWIFPAYDDRSALSAGDYLRAKAFAELPERLGRELHQEERDRMDYELTIIQQKGYSSYFLVVSDYATWARGQGIIFTTRGSAAGSLVCYGIGITAVNPLDYKLPFERFLNPYRPSPPDIDVDFEDARRDEVLEYCKQRYGYEKIAQIVTFGTMKARAAVRDVGRVLGYEYSFCDRLAKMIPQGKQGFAMTLDRAVRDSVDLKDMCDTDERARKVMGLAKKLEGCVRHASVHAAGVVIAPTDITDFMPVQRETGGEKIITQYDMHSVEKVGLLKMDFLGIRNLSILGNAVKIVRRTRGAEVDIWALPLDDKKVYGILARGETMGLFQLSSSGMTKTLMDLQPTNIFDIMAIISLYRPGPIDSIAEFIRRKHNQDSLTYLHPKMKDILDTSYGIITYQDDVLLIAIHVAGYSWEDADKFRKAMGKKIPKEMQAQKAKFIKGAQDISSLSESQAHELWRLIEPFAAYGFNKSHAASYAIVAYQTAYMKAYFPTEFMAALMTAESGDEKKIADAVTECKRMGIQVLPPDVNESFASFTVITQNTALNAPDTSGQESKVIRFGLVAIKNLGAQVVDAVIAERKANGPYISLGDFAKRISDKHLNKKSLESLIKSGSMDQFGERGQILYNSDKILKFARSVRRDMQSGQENLFGVLKSVRKDEEEISLDQSPQASEKEKLAWEKELLGLYISSHPLEKLLHLWKGYAVPLADVEGRQKARVAGIIRTVKRITTKTNEPMLFAVLEDMSGSREIVVFPSVLEKTAVVWKEDEVVVIDGRVSCKDDECKILASNAAVLTEIMIERAQKRVREARFEEGAQNNSTFNGGAGNARESFHSVTISLSRGFSKQGVVSLKNLLLEHPGQYNVFFAFENERDHALKTNIKIDPNEVLQQRVHALVGENKLWIQ
ncbi:MAG: polymerase III, alpha subunit protein [Parcubacteria group bacterium GW2011_GWA2_44_12]|nr:MAG: polymerase III, alpha subunit protein [Parcubacteria group bacterium GW2011_GWA2_44_12]